MLVSGVVALPGWEIYCSEPVGAKAEQDQLLESSCMLEKHAGTKLSYLSKEGRIYDLDKSLFWRPSV